MDNSNQECLIAEAFMLSGFKLRQPDSTSECMAHNNATVFRAPHPAFDLTTEDQLHFTTAKNRYILQACSCVLLGRRSDKLGSIFGQELVKVEHSVAFANTPQLRHIVCHNLDTLGLQTVSHHLQHTLLLTHLMAHSQQQKPKEPVLV